MSRDQGRAYWEWEGESDYPQGYDIPFRHVRGSSRRRHRRSSRSDRQTFNSGSYYQPDTADGWGTGEYGSGYPGSGSGNRYYGQVPGDPRYPDSGPGYHSQGYFPADPSFASPSSGHRSYEPTHGRHGRDPYEGQTASAMPGPDYGRSNPRFAPGPTLPDSVSEYDDSSEEDFEPSLPRAIMPPPDDRSTTGSTCSGCTVVPDYPRDLVVHGGRTDAGRRHGGYGNHRASRAEPASNSGDFVFVPHGVPEAPIAPNPRPPASFTGAPFPVNLGYAGYTPGSSPGSSSALIPLSGGGYGHSADAYYLYGATHAPPQPQAERKYFESRHMKIGVVEIRAELYARTTGEDGKPKISMVRPNK